jgi:hypothetical protein
MESNSKKFPDEIWEMCGAKPVLCPYADHVGGCPFKKCRYHPKEHGIKNSKKCRCQTKKPQSNAGWSPISGEIPPFPYHECVLNPKYRCTGFWWFCEKHGIGVEEAK